MSDPKILDRRRTEWAREFTDSIEDAVLDGYRPTEVEEAVFCKALKFLEAQDQATDERVLKMPRA